VWPASPKDLRDLFPRETGKLTACYYRPGHVSLQRQHPQHHGLTVASFTIAYTNDLSWTQTENRVWVLSIWPRPWGLLVKQARDERLHGRAYYRFEDEIAYEKLKLKFRFLQRLAHRLGR